MLNLFTKYKGLEFFGTYENASGTSAFGGASFKFTQYAVEGIYHFGKDEQFFGGARYNYVKNSTDNSVDRVQIGCWLVHGYKRSWLKLNMWIRITAILLCMEAMQDSTG